MKIFTPKTLAEYVSILSEMQDGSRVSLWYRGCKNAKYELLPSLFRHKLASKPEELAKLERQLVAQFRQRSLPYVTRQFNDENNWDILFFMQHYGIPTRLLDWTENPFTALHFALIDSSYIYLNNGEVEYTESAVVWVLNPTIWNQFSLKHHSYIGGPLTPGDEYLNGYKPPLEYIEMDNYPVALIGAYNSPRIVAQQGVFTIFGQNVIPMEKLYSDLRFPSDSLSKIVIEKEFVKTIRSALLVNGITESIVFPDLEGLAKEIKRVNAFEG